MLPYHLSNFEIQKYCHNEPKFNGVYSKRFYFKKEIKTFMGNKMLYQVFIKYKHTNE